MARYWVAERRSKSSTSFYVYWRDPDGRQHSKSCGPGEPGKRLAKQLGEKIHAELTLGTYAIDNPTTWPAFRAEFEEKVLATKRPGTREVFKLCLNAFERVASPGRLKTITSKTLADFVAHRRGEVAIATVNRDLRHVRAALRKAHRWGYLPTLPTFEFIKEPQKLPSYIPEADFGALYAACDAARLPEVPNVQPADWWRAILTFAYLTGWRVGSILALQWKDVDLDAGTATSNAEDNKGNRDQRIALHPSILEHLATLRSTFDGHVFPSPWRERRHRQSMYIQFTAIQEQAGVQPDGKKVFTFHDLRRGFASMNADRMTPGALQALMQHRDPSTTARYINLSRQLRPAVENLFVPAILRKGQA